MRARYELNDMNLTLSNVTLRDAAESYVLLKASDESGNEVTIKISHDQAEYLEMEFKDLNRRRHGHRPAEVRRQDPVEEQKEDPAEEEYNLFNMDLFPDK
ncbi:hypothetical protein [Bacillus infantis]|jgi:hypothetical protein|uniref:hypothetical protein n=1 Tax=Bacillus infantis TaxID=324767 RepID=UPI0021555F09|nr:hypothetical protein [Bacillus infantis]MCR6612454.1 hypothetical protein [Bacillus infantis]